MLGACPREARSAFLCRCYHMWQNREGMPPRHEVHEVLLLSALQVHLNGLQTYSVVGMPTSSTDQKK